MRIFSALFDNAKAAPKKLIRMVFGRTRLRIFAQSRSGYDFQSAVGDGTGSSTVMAPLQWIMRTFPESPIGLWRETDDGHEERIKTAESEFLARMRKPNPGYSGSVLWQATALDYNVDGNAYWIKVRDAVGRVVEYWWAPHSTMKPLGDETEFITHYEYRPGSETILLAAADVVHFRFGLDPDNPRQGRSPLKSVLREVFTDDEAANFTASLLRNMGVPGLLVSPDSDKPIAPEDAKAAKAYIQESFTGDSRGNALVMTGKTKLEQFGFSPEQLLLKDLRRVPEERVSAVTGVPAIICGLGAGLDRSTFNNFAEARQAAYEQAIIPAKAQMADDLWFQALPDFMTEAEMLSVRVGFDYSRVRVLQEDLNKLSERMGVQMRGGFAKRSEARRACGLQAGPEDEVYIIPNNMVLVSADGKDVQFLTKPTGN